MSAGSQPLKVTVQADTAYAINGVEQIPSAVFGVTAYEGAPWPADPQWQDVLADSGIACLGFQAPIGWCAPAELPEDGIAGIEAWYASDAALHEITNGLLYGARYMYGQILPACRELGIEPMMYVFGQSYPTADEPYAAEYAGYVSLLKRIDPELRWVHILNEPNAYFYRDGKGGADYAELFTAVAGAIKQKCPDVMVGGPVLCWPPAWPPAQTGLPNWYTWDDWTMPLIETAGELLDFFDFHYYGLEPDIAAEEVSAVANALYLERGRRIPVAITECGPRPGALSRDDWADPTTHYMIRTLGIERLLMLYLERPATVMTVQLHDLHAWAGAYCAKFLKGPDPEDQPPTYYMYRIWRHFRGTRLKSRCQNGPINTMAALHDGTAACMVFNDQKFSREIEVSLAGQPDQPATEATARWESIYLDEEANELVRTSGVGNSFRAQPYSTYAVLFDLPEGWKPTRTAQRVELFGDAVMSEFEQVGQELQINVKTPPEALADAVSARVRVGLLGSKSSDRIVMTVGGHSYQLAAGTYFQEVPIAPLPKPGTTTLSFDLLHREGNLGERPSEGAPQNHLRVSSAAIVIEKQA
ncbi:MAG: hypothetical protein KAW89_04840, partial [Armatimonadetes bacterium]|nr:hypothetical protein [Armatimonadota bacterium]